VDTKALLIGLLISYIQPFEDGNKWTARMLIVALLFAYNYPLISYRTITVDEYKQAILAFYEFNSIQLYIEMYNKQKLFLQIVISFRFAYYSLFLKFN
jgi:Fic family protein